MLLTYAIHMQSRLLRKLSAVACVTTSIFGIDIYVIIAGNVYRVYNYVWYYD